MPGWASTDNNCYGLRNVRQSFITMPLQFQPHFPKESRPALLRVRFKKADQSSMLPCLQCPAWSFGKKKTQAESTAPWQETRNAYPMGNQKLKNGLPLGKTLISSERMTIRGTEKRHLNSLPGHGSGNLIPRRTFLNVICWCNRTLSMPPPITRALVQNVRRQETH
jgi:hypothetical protein